jgi:hypothetical protein
LIKNKKIISTTLDLSCFLFKTHCIQTQCWATIRHLFKILIPKQILTTDNVTSFIAYINKINSIVKYSTKKDSVSLIDSFIIDTRLDDMRASSDDQWLIFWWSNSSTNITRLQIRNFTDFSKIKYDRIFSNFVN